MPLCTPSSAGGSSVRNTSDWDLCQRVQLAALLFEAEEELFLFGSCRESKWKLCYLHAWWRMDVIEDHPGETVRRVVVIADEPAHILYLRCIHLI
jgi:hypothetical protein